MKTKTSLPAGFEEFLKTFSLQLANTLIHGFNLPCRISLPICLMVFIYRQKATAFWHLSSGHAWKTNCLLFLCCFLTGVTWTTPTPRPAFCEIPAGMAGASQLSSTLFSGNWPLGSPQQCSSLSPSLGLGKNKGETTWGVSRVVFLHAAVARISVGMSSSFFGRHRGKWVSAALQPRERGCPEQFLALLSFGDCTVINNYFL